MSTFADVIYTSTGQKIRTDSRTRWQRFDRASASQDEGPPPRPETSSFHRRGWKHRADKE